MARVNHFRGEMADDPQAVVATHGGDWWRVFWSAVRRRWSAEKKAYPYVRQDRTQGPRFDQLIPPNAVLEKLAEGFDWAEGPVWDKKDKYLLFSDIPPNSVMKWKEGRGDHAVPQAQRLYRQQAARRRAGEQWPALRLGRAG